MVPGTSVLNFTEDKESKMFEWITAKITSFIGGILGGLSVLAYIPPKNFREAYIRGGVSVGFALMLAQPILLQLGLEMKSSQIWIYELAVAFICGFIGYSVMNWVANFLSKNASSDVLEVYANIKKKGKK